MGKIFAFILKAAMWIAVIVLILGVGARLLFVDLVKAGHNGMAPTLIAGDRVLLWRDAEIDMGDIAVCKHPRGDELVVGRVMAKPGMTITAERAQLVVEGRTAERDLRSTFSFYDSIIDRTHEMRYGQEVLGNTEHMFFERTDTPFRLRKHEVKNGFFLLSDNRTLAGQDSRFFGEVRTEDCLGTLFMRIVPSDETPPELKHSYLEFLK